MKKVVINDCFGGFSLSPKAIKMIAEKQGKECYFFDISLTEPKEYKHLTLEQAEKAMFYVTYSVPNPQDYKLSERDADGLYGSANARAEAISLDDRSENREDKTLIEVVESLGKDANGKHAKLAIVSIPDDVEYDIEEYDGGEWVAEKHRKWYAE